MFVVLKPVHCFTVSGTKGLVLAANCIDGMGRAGRRHEMVEDRCVQEMHIEVRCAKEFRVKVLLVKGVCERCVKVGCMCVIESCLKVLWLKVRVYVCVWNI